MKTWSKDELRRSTEDDGCHVTNQGKVLRNGKSDNSTAI